MCAIELVRDPESRKPADVEAKEIAYQCQHGLITITLGTYNNFMQVLVPLVISDEQLEEALDLRGAAIAAVAERKNTALCHA